MAARSTCACRDRRPRAAVPEYLHFKGRLQERTRMHTEGRRACESARQKGPESVSKRGARTQERAVGGGGATQKRYRAHAQVCAGAAAPLPEVAAPKVEHKIMGADLKRGRNRRQHAGLESYALLSCNPFMCKAAKENAHDSASRVSGAAGAEGTRSESLRARGLKVSPEVYARFQRRKRTAFRTLFYRRA